MTYSEYITNLGFNSSPFQFSNADKESDYLSQYFIQPDYFEDIWGNPYNPVSNIIYAPRGGGKTAQRIMIEKRAQDYEDILTIAYTNHDLTEFKSIEEISLTYHLTYLNRLLLLALFGKIEKSPFDFGQSFDFRERQYLYKVARIYLYDTPASFPNNAIASIKTAEDYVVDIWKGFKEPIANIIKQISKNKGVEIDLSKIEIDKKIQLSHKDNFINIIELLKKAGYNSIMVLIDKVDEQNLTGNNPEASFKLIADLIKDLELLEIPGLSFKFFLWDALKEYTVASARPDRIFSYDLKWDWKQIRDMLNKRVVSYSQGKVESFQSLFEEDKSYGRVILFSELSPRDCVRICNRIISEQFKFDPQKGKISIEIVNNALDIFSNDKGHELITNQNNFKHLTKTNQVSFTIEDLVNTKVASDAPAARNIISPWSTAGYLKKIGLVYRRLQKAVNEYSFQDIRLARLACPTLGLETFIQSKVRQCKVQNCKTIFYRDFDKKSYPCPVCNTETH